MGKKQKIFDDVQVGDIIYLIKFWLGTSFEKKFIRDFLPLTVTSIEKGNSPYRHDEYFDVKTDGGYGYVPVLEKNEKNAKSKKIEFRHDCEVIFDKDTVKELLNKTIAFHVSELEKLKINVIEDGNNSGGISEE